MIHFAPDEVDRLCSLTAFDLVGSVLEPEFDEMAALAADLLCASVGLVSVIGLDEAWVRGCVGMAASPIPRGHHICSYTILQDAPLVVGDLSADARFATMPSVSGDPHLRFYAGAPVSTADGYKIGAICAVDPRPRDGITAVQHRALTGLARVAGIAFDHRRRSSGVKAKAQDNESIRHRALRLSEITLFRADARGNLVSIDPGSPALTALTNQGHGLSAWINFVHPADIDGLLECWRTALARTAPFYAEFRLQSPSDGWRWFQARARPDPSATGVGDWFGTLEDIHLRRQHADRIARLEAKLGHLSRVTAMGTMASTLAHELNQPLAAISSYVRAGQRMAMNNGVDAPHLIEAMDGAVEATMRAGGIIRGMRELVSSGDLERRSVDVAPLIREAYRIAVADRPLAGLETSFDFDAGVPMAVVDPLQIQQVVINMVRNAVQALEGEEVRRLTIATRPGAADRCEISIADTGPGLDPAIAARLFEPFNTSKGDGMGIGLSISRTIVEAHGGSIAAERRPDGGMIFRFTVPTC